MREAQIAQHIPAMVGPQAGQAQMPGLSPEMIQNIDKLMREGAAGANGVRPATPQQVTPTDPVGAVTQGLSK
jgi:hypothetical protein